MPEADKQRQGPGRRTRAGLRKLIFALIEFRIEGIEVFAVKFILDDAERFSETLEVNDFTFPKETDGSGNIRILYGP